MRSGFDNVPDGRIKMSHEKGFYARGDCFGEFFIFYWNGNKLTIITEDGERGFWPYNHIKCLADESREFLLDFFYLGE